MLDLDLLRTFIIFCDSKNIYEAADTLHVTQPSVSIKLKDLEIILGEELFDLKGKKKVLSLKGREFYKLFKPVVENFSYDMESALKKFKKEKLTLKLGARREFFSQFHHSFKNKNRYDFETMSSKEACFKLKNRQIDLAISTLNPKEFNFFSKKIFQSTHQILTHKNLFSDKSLNKKLIYDVPLLLHGKSNREDFDVWIKSLDMNPDEIYPEIIMDDWLSLLELVERGRGFVLAPNRFKIKSKNVLSYKISTQILPKKDIWLLSNKKELLTCYEDNA